MSGEKGALTPQQALDALRPIMEGLDAIKEAVEAQQMTFVPVAAALAEQAATPVPSEVAETTAGEREVCPAKWCAYPMPHDHSSGSGPTFDALLSDPTQQLDTEGAVLASVLAHQSEPRRLTTAEREWLDASMMHGFDALVHTVERLMERAADEVRPRSVAETTAGEREVEALAKAMRDAGIERGYVGADAIRYAWAARILASDWLAALLDRVRREEGERIAQAIALLLCERHQPESPTRMPCAACTQDAARAASVGRGEGS